MTSSAYRWAALPLLALVAATPAAAQSDEWNWSGPYVGVSGGYRFQPSDKKETIEFDTNLDGKFGDTVATAAAPNGNAFSPGFCGGAAKGKAPTNGCKKDEDGFEFGVHAGYDMQFGSMVVGVVGEYNRTSITDSVSAFSTTPASYTMTRKLKDSAGLRLRAGFTTGRALFYVTGGGAWGKVKNSFTTTNTANKFATNGNDDVWGYKIGAGTEFRFTPNMSLGVQYIYTSFGDSSARVRASGGPAGGPFTRVKADGTDFRRSAGRFNSGAVSATLNFRF